LKKKDSHAPEPEAKYTGGRGERNGPPFGGQKRCTKGTKKLCVVTNQLREAKTAQAPQSSEKNRGKKHSIGVHILSDASGAKKPTTNGRLLGGQRTSKMGQK